MKRLTKKIKVRGKDTYRISPSLQHRGEVKLGKLEDIEELLGIDFASIITLDMNDRLVISVEDAEHKKAIVINVYKNQITEELE